MRIVSGQWAGRTLTSPGARIRPTAEGLRDFWLSLIETELEDARVVDLFAGGGAVGLEALSRGARSCDFVENSPNALHALKANVARFKLKSRARIFKRDAIQFIQKFDKIGYDVALADPPYGSRKADRIITDWLRQPFARLLCVEHALDHDLPGRPRVHRFEERGVAIYRAREQTGES